MVSTFYQYDIVFYLLVGVDFLSITRHLGPSAPFLFGELLMDNDLMISGYGTMLAELRCPFCILPLCGAHFMDAWPRRVVVVASGAKKDYYVDDSLICIVPFFMMYNVYVFCSTFNT